MDVADAPGAVAAAAAPPYVSPSSAIPIAVVIAIGFVVTLLILVSYYLLVVRCWLRAGVTGGAPGSSLLPRSRSRRAELVDRVSAVFFADYDEAELPGGVDPDVVAALPVVRYRRVRSASTALECAVCLSDFVAGERLKMLPTCSHAFHIDCIDTWLYHNVSCPLCRTVVTGGPAVVPPHAAARDDLDASTAGDRRIDVAAATRTAGHGSSCRFPKQERSGVAVAQEPIRRSFSMDFFLGDHGRKPPRAKEAAAPSRADLPGSSNSAASAAAGGGGGDTSGRFRRMLSSFGLGRSSRSTAAAPPPMHLDP